MKKLICALLCATGLAAHADRIHCRFDPDNRPSTYLQYDSRRQVVETLSGWDDPTCPRPGRSQGLLMSLPREATIHQCLRTYKNVVLASIPSAPPYYRKGVSLVGFGGDVIFVHMNLTLGSVYQKFDSVYPAEAQWGDARLPGNPDAKAVWYQMGKTRGMCWTDRMQPKATSRNR